MSDHWYSDDDQLLGELGDAIRTSHQVPDRLIEIGMAAFVWRDIDTELAQLTGDSTRPAGKQLAGIRANQGPGRSLTFAGATLTIEVEVTAQAIRGLLVPPQPGEIGMRGDDGSHTSARIDDDGWFLVGTVPDTFQLLVRPATGNPIRTSWITREE